MYLGFTGLPERAGKPGGKFAGLHPEGQIFGGQPYPLPETIPGSWGPVTVRLSSIPGGGLEKSQRTKQTGNRQTENTGISKYTGDNGEDGRHLEGGWRQSQRQVKQIRA